MIKKDRLERYLSEGSFHFKRLSLREIDNEPIYISCGSKIKEEEICLFHQDIKTGDQYFELLHLRLKEAIQEKKGLPVVRFADGEYAFYCYSLKCNGLYQQAESVAAIKKAMPTHVEALKYLDQSGILAPLIFPGNTQRAKKNFLLFWRKFQADLSALRFINFLASHNIQLQKGNYIPFYVIYAYLASPQFAKLVDQKKVCLVCSEFNRESCQEWFSSFKSSPNLVFVEVPDSYLATRWMSIKENILKRIPVDSELFLVGAGIAALLVCVDLAKTFSAPAIDAGHILNMMNGREDKSGGPRLYTFRKKGIFSL